MPDKGKSVFGAGDCLEEEEQAGSSMQTATLGEGGRLAAFDRLGEMQREGVCCDVTLTVGGRHFKAHK